MAGAGCCDIAAGSCWQLQQVMHLMPLQVKLLKCLVDNMVVDISFNQMGGLVTLNFLEEINDLIGNSNIFKRSIILVGMPGESWKTSSSALVVVQLAGQPGSLQLPAGSHGAAAALSPPSQ